MITCEVCGNDLPESKGRCYFCGTHQQRPRTAFSKERERVRTVILKAGLPTAEEGLMRLEAELFKAKQDGVPVLRIVHGWGSGGSEGKLREACRAYLNGKKAGGFIKLALRGEDYSRHSSPGKELLNRYTFLRNSERADSNNPGITFVIL